ncbi:MAG: hypothetical protein M1828_002414 [Chrysothrix sp. TS-e1954]|nr:MAG: hypothetical protein M1828_002414 [Chrysothrix sp. TS-e1954]
MDPRLMYKEQRTMGKKQSIMQTYDISHDIASLDSAIGNDQAAADQLSYRDPNQPRRRKNLSDQHSNLVNISSATLEEMSGTGKYGATPTAQSEKTSGDPSLSTDDVDQDYKPRSSILAEYLGHGNTVSDKAIERGIALDTPYGISARFTSALSNFDDKYKACKKAASLDTRYGVSQKAANG